MPFSNTKYILDNYCESPLLPHEIPNGITHIYINKYNYPIVDNIWPDTVTHLIITKYDHVIHVFPDNLVVLIIENPYNHNLPKFPNGLKFLEIINRDKSLPKLPNLPNGLEKLHLINCYHHKLELPDSLKNLYLYSYDKELPILPNGLQYLKIVGRDYNQPIAELPNKLEILILNKGYNQPLPELPANLRILELGNAYNHPLPKLPDNLTALKLGYKYNYPLSELPDNLRILELGYKYNHALPVLMPSNFEYLHLQCKNTANMILPVNLKYLILYRDCIVTIYENTEVYFPKYMRYINTFIYSQDVYQIEGQSCHKILNYPKLKVPISKISVQERLNTLESQVKNILDKLNHL